MMMMKALPRMIAPRPAAAAPPPPPPPLLLGPWTSTFHTRAV